MCIYIYIHDLRIDYMIWVCLNVLRTSLKKIVKASWYPNSSSAAGIYPINGGFPWEHHLPSGKLLHNYGKS